jgi:hypothetical protein
VIHLVYIALSTRNMALAQTNTSHATRSRVSQGFSRARAQHFQAPLSVPYSLEHYNRTMFSLLCLSHPISFPRTACTGTSTTGIVQHSFLPLLLICLYIAFFPFYMYTHSVLSFHDALSRSHLDAVVALEIEPHLNTCFRHFMSAPARTPALHRVANLLHFTHIYASRALSLMNITSAGCSCGSSSWSTRR